MTFVRPFTAALNSKGRYRYKHPESALDFLVIGGGVIGLSVAQCLARRFPTRSTILVERHPRPGEETSSRNSEVIHSGLDYPPHSYKTRLCLRGRDLLYERCRANGIPHKQVGKLVVATLDQLPYIHDLHAKSLRLSWPAHSEPARMEANDRVLKTVLLSGDEAREMEPDLSPNISGALWCPQTGIVDSSALMESLEKDILESEGASIAYSTQVVRLDPYRPAASPSSTGRSPEQGWVVQTCTSGSEEGDAVFARTVINAGGLSSAMILNSILPREAWIPMYYPPGSYATYHGPGTSHVSHLIYPSPRTGPSAHAFQSLGTHLTLDLDRNIRFGPDIKWISPPTAPSGGAEEDVADFWKQYLVPDEGTLREMHRAVTEYLPGVRLEGLQPGYVGIRPKLVGPGGGFQDFVFRTDFADPNTQAGQMISLLGFESPGLTSCLAIAEIVVEEMVVPRI